MLFSKTCLKNHGSHQCFFLPESAGVQIHNIFQILHRIIHSFNGNVFAWSVEGIAAGSKVRTGQSHEGKPCAICAAAAAHKLGPVLPQPLVVLVLARGGIRVGGLYVLLVALLKVRYNTNETLLTLMRNYIALYLLQFLGETKAGWNFFLDPDAARPKFAGFPDNADMITFPLGPFNLNLSLIIAIVLCVLLFGYLKYTKHGYEIAVVGDSPNTARYAGMKVGRIVVRTIFLSAALIGLAGAFYVSSAGTLSTSVPHDVGWTGIVVAWLAKLNTVGIVITALLITVLQFGCQAASTPYSSIDANFADLFQGIILFAVLAADFFTRFRLARRAAAPKEVSK